MSNVLLINIILNRNLNTLDFKRIIKLSSHVFVTSNLSIVDPSSFSDNYDKIKSSHGPTIVGVLEFSSFTFVRWVIVRSGVPYERLFQDHLPSINGFSVRGFLCVVILTRGRLICLFIKFDRFVNL